MKSPIKEKSFNDAVISIRDLLAPTAGSGAFPRSWHEDHPANKRRLFLCQRHLSLFEYVNALKYRTQIAFA